MEAHSADEVTFRLLGPVRAWRGGAELELGPPQQRAVLAALLLRRGRPVTAGKLADALWGHRPPPGAAATVRSYLSRLRTALEPRRPAGRPAVLLVSTPAGYVLDVPPSAVDLEVFEQRVARARRLRSEGDPAGAGELLRRALESWPGTPLAGIPGPLAHAERARLDERRLAVLETSLEVGLELGRHHELVARLRALCADHPLREGLRELLMLALYRCGRRAEALESYQDIRRVLAAELGAEPGPALRRTHAGLLAASRAPDGTVPAGGTGTGHTGGTARPAGEGPAADGRAGTAGAARPCQLPAALTTFAGREAELARVHALLPAGREPSTVVISAIGGMAGIGKTTLAVYFAHRIADRFPDGQLYVNLRGFDPGGAALDPAEAVRAFLVALGVPPQRLPADAAGQTALYRSLLADRRVLIVLDNARDSRQVRPLLPGTAGCLVIVTSRDQLAGLVAAEGAHPVPLDLLSDEEAEQLLARRIGRERTAAEPEAVREIVRRCARLPLALAVVAARAATHPHFGLRAIAEELREGHGGLDAFAGGEAAVDARAVFSWSYRALPPDAARLFRLLALHPGPEISVSAAAALAGLEPRRVRAPLAALTDAHLLVQRAPGRYSCHDLLRVYAAELLDGADSGAERRAALRRMFDHYLHTAYGVLALFHPQRDTIELPEPVSGAVPEVFGGRRQAMAWLEAERQVLVTTVSRAAATGFPAQSWQLAFTLDLFLDRLGHWHAQHTVQRAALDAARGAGDRLGAAYAERALGFACMRLERGQDAARHLHAALEAFAGLGEPFGQARTHRLLAFAANRDKRHQDALEHYRRALELYRGAGYRSGRASVLNEIGWTHILLGEHQEALEQCARAVALHRETGDRNGEAAAQDSLGYALHHLGRYEEALGCFDHALRLYLDLGDRYLQADTLVHIGDTRQAAGDRRAARSAWRRALDILEGFDHPDTEEVRERLHRLGPEGPEADGTAAADGTGR
ncbi:BTAD domain-containing putative transcriptional regulator [Streptomyces sp. TRM 70361]|uniref:AfsR/SARP family transcriptional regulator n=1 Tax=Streptomyces sp. TRM 70361 TaxID=3116553 RepID=UPI002E7B66B0|nr:BTAD domain-containing putative transcriptional regulator [Streptomyces sp. TRM 70361]MEE1940185.1 BTAD domain-containing putative transcriptional regulator [Streptomyces sp. TRM 70361]